MRSAQRLVGIHHHVDFNDDAGTAVVGADGIDAGDHGGVRHCCFWEQMVRQMAMLKLMLQVRVGIECKHMNESSKRGYQQRSR